MKSDLPLLMLAQGRRPRPRKAIKIVERETRLHFDAVDAWRRFGLQEWRMFHPANGEPRSAAIGMKLKRMGVLAGTPDLVLINPEGRVHFVELKRIGEQLSESQEYFREWAVRHGIPFAVVYDLTQFLAAIDAWGGLALKIARPA